MSNTELKEIGKKSSHSSKSSVSSERRHNADSHSDVDGPEVQFIQPNHSDVKLSVGTPEMEFTGLSKEELMQFANDPSWKKVRLVLFILFWVLWGGMLVAAIIIIVCTPKCPTIPKQTYWQKSPGYLLDVAKFKDSDGNGIGDIQGVTKKMDYLATKSGFLVLQSVIAGSLGNGGLRSSAITDFKAVDAKIGSLEDVKNLLKNCRKKNMKAVIEFPPHTGINHPWFQKALKSDAKYRKYFIWSSKGNSKMVNRVGDNVWNKVGSNYYWSSLDKSMPALNLQNQDVLADLKDAVQFWLNQGFDGIFMDNVAFLAPEFNTSDIGSGLDMPANFTGSLKKWYSTGHNGQLHTIGSVEFVKKVRSWVDEVKEKSDRERLFLVSAGNTGLRQNQNQTLRYLGDAEMRGAHSVLLFDLVDNQGAKVISPSVSNSLKERLSEAIEGKEAETTFVTQAPTGPRSTDAIKTYLNLLLPGTPLTVYGEEIGISGYGDALKPTSQNSEVPYWYLTKAALSQPKMYSNDLVDSYNVPMQWTVSGGFSTNTSFDTMKFPNANVMSMSTVGRGTTHYNIFEDIIQLRKKPSLNWGATKWIEVQEKAKPHHYIFSRSAKGFPTYVIVLIQPTIAVGGIARDLSEACKKSNSKLSFPANAEFSKMEKMEMKNVYFRYNGQGSIYLFECV